MAKFSSSRFPSLTLAALAAAAIFIVPAVASAAEPWERNPAFLDKRDPVPQASGRAADGGLAAEARKQGRIRVLVELEVPTTAATAGDETAGFAALAAVQDAVIAATFGSSAAATSAAGSEAGIRRYEIIPFLSLTVTPAELERLIADGRVLSIQEDIPAPPVLNEALRIIHAVQAQKAGFDGKGFAVAVIDSGVEAKHPMLKGHVKAEACFSSNVRGAAKTVCPNGRERDEGGGSARPCGKSIAGCDHGTHVASIAAGSSGRRDGVAPGAKIVAVQVFSRFDKKEWCGSIPAPCALSYSSDQISGLEFAYKQRKAHAIAAANISIGSGAYKTACDKVVPAMTDIIRRLRKVDVATVIAAGNGGNDNAISGPACISVAIAVAASSDRDRIPTWSNWGSLVDLVAPGVDILAAVPGGYGTKSGTSMAAPMVAGAIAVLRQADPSAGVGTIVETLADTGEPISRDGRRKPRIDVNAARKALQASGS
ncbi:S8 family serine peptidase [Pseudoxanthobacter sp. M-2]|uniref:S8 family peptidase n=1 Tax=Pseudoxanthobacter sp. M-2 TaxID=3078754 RepID=UPI0038FC6D45